MNEDVLGCSWVLIKKKEIFERQKVPEGTVITFIKLKGSDSFVQHGAMLASSLIHRMHGQQPLLICSTGFTVPCDGYKHCFKRRAIYHHGDECGR